ncbi:MAG: TIM barrel protein [Candidatus Aenigmarchaeota archaeon]|nr:TIM barrel protein [Candidatus Aenigmarchaeota archaeon]
MTMDMIIRKKALKIQERLGMNIGVAYGIHRIPTVKTTEQALTALRELYKIGLRAFLLPKELFSGILTTTDLYKNYYGELLKIKELAKKFNIELAIHHSGLGDQPDEDLKTFCNICSIMDCRTFIIHPTFYSRMPHEQALRLAVYKINEITTNLRVKAKIGIETTGKNDEVGSLEDVIDIVKRTHGTEPIINWAHLHARGYGTLRTENDYMRILSKLKHEIGRGWVNNAYFLFSGVSYGPQGEIKHIPLRTSDMQLSHMIKESMAMDIKGTLILEDPEKEKLILRMLEDLADMVR